MSRTWHRHSLIAVALGALLISAAAPASAAWDPTRVLRSIPGGELLTVRDMAALGKRVVVGWQEDGAVLNSFMRWSTDGAATWKAHERLDTRPNRELRVDTCRGWAWGVSGLRDPGAPAGEWLIALNGFEMATAQFEASLVSSSGQGRGPDVACAGTKRLAIAWFQKGSSGHRVKLFSRAVLPDVLGDPPPEVRLDLGKGSLRRGLAVAATADRIYVAWFAGSDLKVKAFRLGGGPDYPVTPLPTRTLGSLPYGNTPEIGAADTRVVLAYMNRADLVARSSADRGASWGPQRRLLDEPFPAEIGAFPTNADIHGSRMLVSGTEIGGVELPDGRGFLYTSTDDGASWGRVRRSVKRGGVAVGALMAPGGTTKMAQAWDGSLIFEAGMFPQQLRFRRQS